MKDCINKMIDHYKGDKVMEYEQLVICEDYLLENNTVFIVDYDSDGMKFKTMSVSNFTNSFI